MPLNEDYREDILDPEFCDGKIVASDGGEILANKAILDNVVTYLFSGQLLSAGSDRTI